MSLTNFFNCDQIRNTVSGTECQLMVGFLTSSLGYPQVPTACVYPQPEWCTDYSTAVSNPGYTYYCNPDLFNHWQPTWETCAEVSGSQCRFEKTVLDAKYASGTYCPYGNDSKGQVEPTYIIGIGLLLWAIYAMMFFGNSRR